MGADRAAERVSLPGLVTAIKERCELHLFRDLMCLEEMRQDCCGRLGISECVVGIDQCNVVALSNVGEPVGQLPIRVKSAGHAERAQAGTEVETGVAPGCVDDEPGVEAGIVRGEHGAIEAEAEFL